MTEKPSADEYLLLQKILDHFGLTIDETTPIAACESFAIPEMEKRYQLLTPKEQEVFRLLALGVHAKHVAVKLDIMPKTVSVHKNSIYKKLEIRTEIELLKVALGANVINVQQLMEV